MVWANPPPYKSEPPKKGKVITPEDLAKSGSEDGHQMALFCWAASMCGQYPALRWLHAIPNGGSRHIVEAGKMVAAGLRSGVWDVFLPCPIRDMDGQGWIKYAGLYIEMKEPKRRTHKYGGLSQEQVDFGNYARNMGYFCAVCYTWEEARDVILKYMRLEV